MCTREISLVIINLYYPTCCLNILYAISNISEIFKEIPMKKFNILKKLCFFVFIRT